MIRFSAALVAVAIAVLIGGIAASELSLVYIAIVVSAVALAALATGVVLKREELFGEGQGLAPAVAGASPALPVRAGDSHDQHRHDQHRHDQHRSDQHRLVAPVTPPPLQGVVVGPGAAFGRTSQAASAQSAAPWETQASRGPWPSVATDVRPAWTTPAVPDERTGNGAEIGADSRVAAARQPAAASSSGTAAGRGVPGAGESPAVADAAAQGGPTAPWAWAAPSPSAFSSTVPEARPATGGGSGSTPPSWFDRWNTAASADVPATATGAADTGAADTGAADTAALDSTAAQADAATAVDEDDDWPTRYSWLDDDPDENGEGSADKPDENIGTDPGDHSSLDDHSPPSPVSAATPADEPAAAGDAGTPDTETPDVEVAEATAAGFGDADQAGDADADDAAPVTPGDPAGLSPVADPGTETAAEAESGESEPSAATTADPAPGAGLMAVIRGVPRYHDPECVLIRFMPEGDVQKHSTAQAKELGCTPCAACQPEG